MTLTPPDLYYKAFETVPCVTQIGFFFQRLKTMMQRCVMRLLWPCAIQFSTSLRWPWGPRRKYISEVKPDAMGKIQPAHELAWFLCVMGSSGNQASTRLSESGSGFRAICTHKFKGAVIVKLSVNGTDKVFLLKKWLACDMNYQYYEIS